MSSDTIEKKLTEMDILIKQEKLPVRNQKGYCHIFEISRELNPKEFIDIFKNIKFNDIRYNKKTRRISFIFD